MAQFLIIWDSITFETRMVLSDASPLITLDKMKETYMAIFKQLPKKWKTPLEKGDHPEVDDSPLLDEEQISHYLTLIGQIQWLVTLGRIDVFSACVTMSKFRHMPRQGHIQ